MQYIAMDIGASLSEAVIMDKNGNIIEESRQPSRRGEALLNQVLSQLDQLKKGRIISAVAICCSGIIEDGRVLFSPTLDWQQVDLSALVESRIGAPVTVINDANAAGLGEYYFGAGKNCPDILMLTLGNSVGGAYIRGGIVLNEKGGELGHMVINQGGEPCMCGGSGCLTQYASGEALVRETKKAMAKHKESAMWDFPTVDGATAFLAEGLGDVAARRIVDEYIINLSAGICSLNNIFRPSLIVLGGGISSEGENLLSRLRIKLASVNYGYKNLTSPKLVTARLGRNAGLFGAYAKLTKFNK